MRELIEKWDEYIADKEWRIDHEQLTYTTPSFENFMQWLKQDLLSTSQE